jgi:hypothetical protein
MSNGASVGKYQESFSRELGVVSGMDRGKCERNEAYMELKDYANTKIEWQLVGLQKRDV